MTSARRRVAFFVAGFFFADDFFLAARLFFAVRFFGAAFLVVFFLAEAAFLAADFFRVDFFLPTAFFLRAGFFLAMGKVYQNSPHCYTYAAAFLGLQFILLSRDPFADVQRQCVSAFIYRFLCLWILLGIAVAIFDHRASYRTKKFWHPYITIGTGAIFLGFVELMFHGQLPIFFIFWIALITFLNLRNVRFCPKCNRRLVSEAGHE